ncbi:MAG: cupin domain-containing protein [Planctomycetia bacterium]|nr:cupin domain-containing protein [Planctomycetia bacterium]
MIDAEHELGSAADLAALYLAGAMTHVERGQFESHLEAGCATCDRELLALDPLVASLARLIEPIEPGKVARVAALALTNEKVGELAPDEIDDLAPLVTAVAEDQADILADALRWQKLDYEGATYRQINVDRQRRRVTSLVRMEPGAAIPAHQHEGAEQCTVLSGDFMIGGRRLLAGEYKHFAPGEFQPVATTSEGCLLLVTTPFE